MKRTAGVFVLAAFRRVRKFAKSRLLASSFASARPRGTTERFVMRFHVGGFFENLSRKSTFYSSLTRKSGTLHKDFT